MRYLLLILIICLFSTACSFKGGYEESTVKKKKFYIETKIDQLDKNVDNKVNKLNDFLKSIKFENPISSVHVYTHPARYIKSSENVNISNNNHSGIIKEVETKIIFSSNDKIYFPSGKYIAKKYYKGFPEFSKSLYDFIKNIKELDNKNIYIKGDFIGEADGDGYHGKTRISYKGELGHHVVIKNAKINGKSRTVTISKGEKLMNSKLALLRAFSVYKYIVDTYGDVFGNLYSIVGFENKAIGKEYRCVTIKLLIILKI